jgi:hypothetical protein
MTGRACSPPVLLMYMLTYVLFVCDRSRCSRLWPILWRIGIHMKKGQAFLWILRSCTWYRWVSYYRRVIKRHPCHLSPLNVMLLPVMCFMSSGGHRFKSKPGHQLSWLTFACFPQFRQRDSRMMSQVKLTLLPPAVFPVTSVAVHPTFRHCIVKSCWQCR